MYIAVFGDLHGKIKLAYKLCHRWQREHNETLDLILQVGDLGVWPDISKLDKATARFAAKEPLELGFQEFLEGSDELDDLFYDKENGVAADLYFCKGNHEDFDFLRENESRQPACSVDAYQKLNHISNGRSFVYSKDKEKVSIAALGGLDIKITKNPDRKPKDAYFTDKELHSLALQKNIDVLLTHQGYDLHGIVSDRLTRAVRDLHPVYHFFGHKHVESDIKNDNSTILVEMNLLEFKRKSGRLTRQGFGILYWEDKDNHAFSFVNDPWLEEYTKFTWEDI